MFGKLKAMAIKKFSSKNSFFELQDSITSYIGYQHRCHTTVLLKLNSVGFVVSYVHILMSCIGSRVKIIEIPFASYSYT